MPSGLMFGSAKENGVWIARSPRWRFMFDSHDALYVAAARLRLRLMKPRRDKEG